MSKKLDFEFLAVNNIYFQLQLNPTQIFILAKVDELNRNCGECFVSDETLAELFGVSKSTVSREIKALVDKGFIVKETRNIKGGRVRYMKVDSTKVNLTIEEAKKQDSEELQTSNCLLTNVNLPIVNKQNDFIKENIKEKEKELEASSASSAEKSSIDVAPEAGSISNPIAVDKEWLLERYNELNTTLANGLYCYCNQYYVMK